MGKKEEEKIECPLIDKEVFVKPIKREGSWLEDIHKEHDGIFMFSGAQFALRGLPTDEHRKVYIDPLTPEERAWFESEDSGLGLSKGDLSVLKKPCWWDKFEINFNRNGLNLNLNNTMDYLRYKFLLIQPQIAPSWKEGKKNAEYKFALVDSKEEIRERVSSRDKKKRAERFFGKIEDSVDKLKSFLIFYNEKNEKGKVPNTADVEFLVSEIEKIMESDINGFLTVADDKDFDTKVLIYEGVNKGAILKEGKSKYKINGEEDTFLFSELVDFLKDTDNQLIRGKIKAVIEN